MSRYPRFLRFLIFAISLGGVSALIAAGGVYWYLLPKLPSVDTLRDVRLQVPLRVYTEDGLVIAKFGEKRRTPLRLDQVPQRMIQAVIASEDERFFEHPGVDWQGLTRAVIHLLRTGEKGPGGSTITMQVARNFFLGREKTYLRKLNEILLALKIEQGLSKHEILELYLNKIFLGHRAYGIGAAAQVYYGTTIDKLKLEHIAMIAGLPKAPSRFNPIVNPERAVTRRNYVLGRMRQLDFIDEPTYVAAKAAPVTASVHGLSVDVEAPYVAEMVRAKMEERFSDQAYTAGYQVYTSLHSRLQRSANRALRNALLGYEERHGFRGAELQVAPDLNHEQRLELLKDIPVIGELPPALVTEVAERSVTALTLRFSEITIGWEGLHWARAYVNENRRGPVPETAGDIVQPGDVVRVQLTEEGWRLAQLPGVEGALVSLNPVNGAMVALSGGFDFYRSKFNRVMQARRQPGSSFKPLIYSAAIEKGYTSASIINDAPVVFDAPGLEAAWRPENYSGKFFGPTRLRFALTKSRNLVSIRLLRAIGLDYALTYLKRFGLDVKKLPRNLSLALGSGTVAPIELARGYAVLANGGYLIDPFFIVRILDADGKEVYVADPVTVCRTCDAFAIAERDDGQAPDGEPGLSAVANDGATTDQVPADVSLAPRVLEARNVWVMNSLMRDVIQFGTGRKAKQLGRKDLAGKTGTTNDQQDAWFSGFNPGVVTTAWVGFDQLKPLGARETGGRAALPMWIEYMGDALGGVPEAFLEQPEGLVTVRINSETGKATGANDTKAIFETFRTEYAPVPVADKSIARQVDSATEVEGVTEQLF